MAADTAHPPHTVRPRRRHPAVFPLTLLALAGAGMVYLVGHNPHDAGVPMWQCPFHWLTGLDCPSCGATRMVYDLMHARWRAAWTDNAMLLLATPMGVGLFGTWLWHGIHGRRYRLRLKPVVTAVILAIAVSWAIYRNLFL
ncbi:MAG: DUF2752 domain-containing protein [Stackebrandtia sp.]